MGDPREIFINIGYLISRYIHVVATAVLVGGTLFYEMVVPLAIGELKTEQQLAVFARMRWVFRWLVYSSAVALLITGGISIIRNLNVLDGDYEQFLAQISSAQTVEALKHASIFNRPALWFIAHLASGALSLLIALLLVSGGRPPDKPLQWMKINLFFLLLAMFLASASRNSRLRLFEGARSGQTAQTPPSARD